MEKKITKRDVITSMLEDSNINTNKVYVAYLENELVLLDKKKASGTKTKVQVENDNLKKVIVETLQDLGKFVTIVELQSANASLAELSNQKISALLKQLVDSQTIRKQVDKRKAYFGV